MGKDNGVCRPLKAAGDSREVSGTIRKKAIRSIGLHLRFPAPSFFFHYKIKIAHFLFHHFSFKWQLVALRLGQKRQIDILITTQMRPR
ncbi:hypothetical protein C7120_08405 [Prevotella sp. oral taxon 376]|nr:hypothetical protein C7120_08405 [Prevotella sp. oral taxon 376]